MITQQINISFSSAMADTIRIHTAETGRVIVFIPDVLLEQDQSAEIIIVKPDNTFVIDDATIANGLITVTMPEQAGAVSGVGGYILKVYKDSLCVYSASGPLMVDDHLLTDGMIESVAEAHGYVFPDDFLTDDDIEINPTSPAFATLTKIKYKGITYEVDGGAEDLDDLTDVTLTNPENGEVLTYDGQKWVNEALFIPDDLDDLDDVTITSPENGNVLQYDGTGWKNAALSIPDELSDLSDVAITSPAAGNVLTYNGAAWQNQNLTIPEDLDDLDDVEISAPEDGQQLVYNDGVWENQTITPVVSKTATGNPIELTDAASAPLVKCVTQITGYQSGTGTPSPDNIRPIVAYTEGEIEVRGKNIFDPSLLIQNKSINAQGEVVNTDAFGIFGPYRIDGGDTLDISFTTTSDATSTRIHAYDAQDNWIEQIDVITSNTVSRKSLSFTVPNNAKYLRISTRYGFSDFQLEKGSTATTYEPYKGVTHTTTYPTSIYRGSEDVVNGEVTSEMGVDNGADLTWQVRYTGSVNKTLSANLTSEYPSTNPGIIAEDMAYIQNAGGASVLSDPDTKQVGIYGYSGTFITTVIYMVAPISYTPSGKIVYNLVTPTTSSVTPTNLPIKSLSGYNHIESTTGDMEVEYITKTYEPIIKAMEQLIPANTRSIQSPIQNTIEETPQEIQKIVPEDEKEVGEEDVILRLTDEEGGEENADQRLTDE